MTTGSEYRRAKRRKVEHSIEVLDTMTEQVIGHVSDLSETGMLMILNHALVSDALYQVRFKLSDAQGREHAIDIGVHELGVDYGQGFVLHRPQRVLFQRPDQAGRPVA